MGLLLLIEMFVAVFGLVFKVIGGVLLLILKVAFVLVRGMLMQYVRAWRLLRRRWQERQQDKRMKAAAARRAAAADGREGEQ